jgi:hypothetical protein
MMGRGEEGMERLRMKGGEKGDGEREVGRRGKEGMIRRDLVSTVSEIPFYLLNRLLLRFIRFKIYCDN